MGWLPSPEMDGKWFYVYECLFAARGRGTDFHGNEKRRIALLSMWVHRHSRSLLGLALNEKDVPSLNKTSIAQC